MTETDTRDERGRFKVGNPGGPGRNPRVIEEAVLDLLASIVLDDTQEAAQTRKDLQEAFRKGLKRGNIDFVREYLDRTTGKPKQKTENTGSEGGPLSIVVTYKDKEQPASD